MVWFNASTAQKGFETISSSCRADMLRQLADVHWLAGAAAEARRFYSLHSMPMPS